MLRLVYIGGWGHWRARVPSLQENHEGAGVLLERQ